jgi:uncharacterized protein (TIGR03435 family)
MMKKATVLVTALALMAAFGQTWAQGSVQDKATPPPQRKQLTEGAQAHTQGKLAGNWQGTLQTGEGEGLRTVLKIAGDDGKYRGALYSIDQGGEAIAMSSVSLQGPEVIFTIKSIGLTYKGTLNPDGNTISGSSTQGKETHTLNLARVSEEDTWAIPEPAKPMAKDADPAFEVATIKPSKPSEPGKTIDFEGRHFTMVNYNVNDLLSDAYGLHARQIIGAPAWFDTELYDIDGVPDVPGEPSDKQADRMLQKLLADRFALKFHHEQRELSVFAITVAKGGPKMTVSAAGQGNEDVFEFGRLGDLTARNITMDEFAKEMQGSVTDRPVVDRTGLTEHYDFRLRWTPDDSQFVQFRSAGIALRRKDNPNGPPPLDVAMQQKIGLRIEPTKAMVDVIVIDHVEHPSPN